MELYGSCEIGPLEVAALSLTLPGLRFPIDLSGGVPRFRNIRGVLGRIELRLALGRFARWVQQGSQHVVGELEQPVQAWVRSGVVGIGFVGSERALAFDLVWAPDAGTARFVVDNARALPANEPALGQALRAVDSLFSSFGQRRGRVFSLSNVAQRVTAALLPNAGARIPDTRGGCFGELFVDGDELRAELDTGLALPSLSARAVSALELADLVVAADDALAGGHLDAARAGYLNALEQAPLHPDLAKLVCAIDVALPDRASSALGILKDAAMLSESGLLGAELLARQGDAEAACEVLSKAAEAEPFAPLSALMWARLSEFSTLASERRKALDLAVARAPSLKPVRFARFFERVQTGDIDGATADAEHLEAATLGASGRHALWRRAARALLDAGFHVQAGKFFERALRYGPDDASSTAGLARSLADSGQKLRAASLLSRAVTLSERSGQPDADALIDLGRLLADEIKDLPQAVARVRQVSASSPRVIEARYYEGLWRSRLGDLAGASLAFARMRELVELSSDVDPRAPHWLGEAADFELASDVLSAERHLAQAIKLSPYDETLLKKYREVAAGLREQR